MKRFTLIAALLAGSFCFLTNAAFAQSAPAAGDKPIKILVGFPPGGSADVIARLMAERMQSALGQNVIVENRAGASGRIAIDALKASAPDGNSLIIMPSGPVVIFPHGFKKLSYDPVKDLTPISQLASFQFAVVSGPKTNVKTIAEMVAKSKSDSSGNSYGSSGNGTVPHFLGVMLGDAAKIDFQHVPFQGGAPAMNALLGGHIGYNMDVVSEALENHKAGKARVIAVTGMQRASQMPEVPTLREQGIPMDASAWFAMYGPANMPPAVLAKLNQTVVAALKDAVFRKKISDMGFEPSGSTPEQLAAVQRADLAKWEKPVKASGFQAD